MNREVLRPDSGFATDAEAGKQASREAVFQAIRVRKIYKDAFGRNQTLAFDGRDFSLYRGESLGLAGPSGCGKSTMAKILLRLTPFDSGQVLFKGEDISRFDRSGMVKFRRSAQLIVQRPESFFDPRLKFGRSIKEAVFLLRKSDAFDTELAELMEKLDLHSGLLDRYPHQISGGEIQRLSILRALMVQPEVILFDEATSMLDVSTQAKIVLLLQSLKEERGLTYLFISHDRVLIDKICNRIVEFS